MLLTIEDIHVYYGHIYAVKGVSLEVAEGEIVAVMGSNGAGKSTTIKALCGLVKPKQGRIRLAGQDITRLNSGRIAQAGVGYVPEGRRVFAQMSVLENLMIGAYARHRAPTLKQELTTVYSYFPILESRAKMLAGTLSGGEQQMLALGRALMTRPKLLVLDEPSLGLAPLVVREIFHIIADLRRTGVAILLVEQNARAALQIADYGYVLETGDTVLQGAAGELAANPRIVETYLGLSTAGGGEGTGARTDTTTSPSAPN